MIMALKWIWHVTAACGAVVLTVPCLLVSLAALILGLIVDLIRLGLQAVCVGLSAVCVGLQAVADAGTWCAERIGAGCRRIQPTFDRKETA